MTGFDCMAKSQHSDDKLSWKTLEEKVIDVFKSQEGCQIQGPV